MIAIPRKFLRRPAADRRLLVQALLLHSSVAVLLRVVRFGRLRRWLGTNHAQPASAGTPRLEPLEIGTVERVAWAVQQAIAVAPWGRTCLTEALTMAVLLRRMGCETTVRYGVASDETRRLAAHAWLEVSGAVVGRSTPQAYVPLLPGRTS